MLLELFCDGGCWGNKYKYVLGIFCRGLFLPVLYSVRSTFHSLKVALKNSLLLGSPPVHIPPAIGITSKDPLLNDHVPVEGFSKAWGY